MTVLHHHGARWIGIALATGLALLAFEAAGQSGPAAAAFEGRPALAGAQAGTGALAGPAQGGIGLQGTAGAQIGLRLPRQIREERAAALAGQCPGTTRQALSDFSCVPEAADDRLDRRLAMLGIDAQQRGGL